MAKPRTNAAACAYWADGILMDEPQSEVTVNSIIVRGDTVFSFGSHFPMGKIVRNEDGRCTRVVINSDRWGAGGFANTNGDLYTCLLEARERAEKRKSIRVVELPLTSHNRDTIQCLPREDDPEPEAWYYTEVPTYFLAWNPGPEPVKDPNGCRAGTREEDTFYGEKRWCYQDDHWHARHPNGNARYSKVIEGETYEQCPHCENFDAIHERWSVRYHGKPYGRGSGRGFKLYSEMMDRFGSEEEWREGRKADWARVRDGRKARADWVERNFIPIGALSQVRAPNGVTFPKVTPDGYATRKDQERYFRSRRAAERAERQRRRDAEQHAKYLRQLERFKCGVRRRRKPGFEQLAAEVATTLSHINAGLKVTVSINDSRENAPMGDIELTDLDLPEVGT